MRLIRNGERRGGRGYGNEEKRDIIYFLRLFIDS